jgi:hypothetical protein
VPISRDMLLSELKELQRLTAFEQTIATVRRAQAASTPIAQELAANAARSGERLALLAQAVRGVGGTPDVVGPVLGRFSAFLQTQVNQVQTLQGALLGDLALEHQIRERARYARTLAVSLGESSVVPVLDRLEAAHTETIAWLERRLGEVGRTGTSALRATPVQSVVGSVRKVALTPFALAADNVNRVGALVQRFSRRAPALLTEVQETAEWAAGQATDKAAEVAGQAVETVQEAAGTVASGVSAATATAADSASSAAETVADTASSAAETVADTASSAADTVAETVTTAAEQTGATADQAADAVGAAADTAPAAAGVAVSDADRAAQATQQALEATGGDDVDEDKAPFAGYERLTGDSIMRHVNDTEDVEELRVLLAFEQAHKARKGVLKTVQDRLTELSTSV